MSEIILETDPNSRHNKIGTEFMRARTRDDAWKFDMRTRFMIELPALPVAITLRAFTDRVGARGADTRTNDAFIRRVHADISPYASAAAIDDAVSYVVESILLRVAAQTPRCDTHTRRALSEYERRAGAGADDDDDDEGVVVWKFRGVPRPQMP